MFCNSCGRQITDGASICPACGAALKNEGTARTGSPQAKAASRISAAGTVWSTVCLAANLALAIIGIIAVSSRRSGCNAAGIVAIVAAFVAVYGYAILLFACREGFYVICVAALAGVITNILTHNTVNAVFGFVNPVIAWFFIKSSWARMGQAFDKPRNRNTALVLACIPLTGLLGLDRLYLGYGWLGLFKTITYGGVLAWYVVDIVRLAKNTMRDAFGNALSRGNGSPAVKEGTKDKTKSLRIWGIVLISMGLIVGINGVVQMTSGGSSESAGSFIMGPVLFIGVGLFLLIKGLKRKAQ